MCDDIISRIEYKVHQETKKTIKAALEGDINCKTSCGKTALMLAARDGDVELTKVLIERGADVNTKDNISWGPLILAVNGGNIEIANLLIENGADVNTKNNIGVTPLMFAAKNFNVDMVELLLKNGADPKEIDDFGYSAYYVAVDHGDDVVYIENPNSEIIKMLSKYSS